MSKKRSSIHRPSIRRPSRLSLNISQPFQSRKQSVLAYNKHLSSPLEGHEYSGVVYRNNSVIHNRAGLPVINSSKFANRAFNSESDK